MTSVMELLLLCMRKGGFLFECKMYSRVHLKKYFFALPSAKIVVKIFYRRVLEKNTFQKRKSFTYQRL